MPDEVKQIVGRFVESKSTVLYKSTTVRPNVPKPKFVRPTVSKPTVLKPVVANNELRKPVSVRSEVGKPKVEPKKVEMALQDNNWI
ncbi:hypothetical protein L1987_20052 [Smallanthus sonchifolius]|uniref:Uncharacterized protein n=1 Tax=Smallanthus sonchifolius TaxID=185202 RepID=A0ACB9ISU2_9ASTR|nr:hypothetical protein L1987_20052 [Smallanthus sonchifolius]